MCLLLPIPANPIPYPAPAERKGEYGDALITLDLPPQWVLGRSLSIPVASCPFTTSCLWSPKLVPISTGGLTGGCQSH